MSGEHRQDQQQHEPIVITPAPEPGTAGDPAFYRGPDGKIYRRDLDWNKRLETLAGGSRAILTQNTAILALPVGFAILSLFFFLFSFMGSGTLYNGNELTYTFLVFFLITVIVLIEYGVVYSLRQRLRTVFNAGYRRTLSALHYTDLAVLIADDQFVQLLLDETAEYPLIKWVGSGKPATFEDRLWFAADYCRVLNHLGTNSVLITKDLKHGSCMHFSGTRQSQVLGWLTSVSCIMIGPNPCCSALPAWGLFTMVNRNMERSGNLKAICDFFLDDYAQELNNLVPPMTKSPVVPDWNTMLDPPHDTASILRESSGPPRPPADAGE